jgi:hypothetical protein
MSNQDRPDYQQIASNYGITVHKVEEGDETWNTGGSVHLNHSFCGGIDEIVIGVYEDVDWEIASFFHELGHCITTNTFEGDYLKFHIELDAWMVGLQEAYKYGYVIQPSTLKFMIECLESYIGWEEREVRGYKNEKWRLH